MWLNSAVSAVKVTQQINARCIVACYTKLLIYWLTFKPTVIGGGSSGSAAAVYHIHVTIYDYAALHMKHVC